MAEISYPFAADSAGGGSNIVSQVDWQNMAHLWAQDRIDFQLTSDSFSATALPFYAALSGSNLVVQPGSAWVGGFYYKLDAPWTHAAPVNTGTKPRHDLIVLRADLSAGSVNLAIKTGTPATTPVDPPLQKSPGGIWEMALYSVRLEANSGGVTFVDLKSFDGPGTAYAPWYRAETSETLPLGTFTLDMDSNQTGGIEEGFHGKEGDMITRTLSKRTTYTPDLFTVSNKPASSSRKGYWRYIAPGTIAFSAEFTTGSHACEVTSGQTIMGFSLPRPVSNNTRQVFSGFVRNPRKSNSLPNFIDVTAMTGTGSNTNCYLYMPNYAKLTEGMDGLRTIPAYSTITINGVYETSDLD